MEKGRADGPSRRGFLKGGVYLAAGLASVGVADVLAACGAGANTSSGSSGDPVQHAYDTFVKKEMPGVPIELLRAAQKEGSLNAYLLVPDYNKDLVKSFQDTFPFVKVQVTQLNGGPLLAKFLAEVRGNQPIADLVQFSSLSDANNAKGQGYVLNYKVSSESQLNMTSGVPGYIYPVTGEILTICYSTQAIKDSAASSLRNWNGILNSHWNGKTFAVGEVLAGGTTQLLNYYLYKSYGTSIWQRMAKTKYGIYPGGNPEVQAVLSGEHDIAYGVPQSLAVTQLQKKAPLHWTNPQPWLASPYAQFVSAKATHVNAAKLFQEFTLTTTAQGIIAKYGGISYRKGFKASTSFSNQSWYQQVDPSKYWTYSDQELGAAMPDIAKQWRSIFK